MIGQSFEQPWIKFNKNKSFCIKLIMEFQMKLIYYFVYDISIKITNTLNIQNFTSEEIAHNPAHE